MKKYYLSIIAMLAVILTGCNDKNEFSEDDKVGEPAMITLNIASSPQAYVETEGGLDEESYISQIEVYIFRSNETRDQTTDYFESSYTPAKKPGETINDLKFNVEVGSNKKFLVAINLNLGQLEGKSYEQVRTEIIKAQSYLNETNSHIIPTKNSEVFGLGMSGKAVDKTITEDEDTNIIQINVSRLVGRINKPVLRVGGVIIKLTDEDLKDVFGTTDTPANTDLTFSMDGYAVINGLNLSYAFPYYNATEDVEKPWDLWNPKGAYRRSAFDGAGDLTMAYSGEENGSPWLKNTEIVYVYENQPEESISKNQIKGYDRETVYAFLIKGTLTDNRGILAPEIRYWRVNLIKEDWFTIFRNNSYRVTLSELLTKGYGTAKEAEEDEENTEEGDGGGGVIPGADNAGMKITIDIQKWNVKRTAVQF